MSLEVLLRRVRVFSSAMSSKEVSFFLSAVSSTEKRSVADSAKRSRRRFLISSKSFISCKGSYPSLFAKEANRAKRAAKVRVFGGLCNVLGDFFGRLEKRQYFRGRRGIKDLKDLRIWDFGDCRLWNSVQNRLVRC